MKIVTEKIELQSKGLNPTFHDITADVKEMVAGTRRHPWQHRGLLPPHHLLGDDPGMLARQDLLRP